MARKFVSGVLAFAMVFGATAPVVFAEPVATEVVDQDAIYTPTLAQSTVTLQKKGDKATVKVNDAGAVAKVTTASTNFDVTYSKGELTVTANKDVAADEKITITFSGEGDTYLNAVDLTVKKGTPSTVAVSVGDLNSSDMVEAGKTVTLDIKVSGVEKDTTVAPKNVTVALSDTAKNYYTYNVVDKVTDGKVVGKQVVFTATKGMTADEMMNLIISGKKLEAKINATYDDKSDAKTVTLPNTTTVAAETPVSVALTSNTQSISKGGNAYFAAKVFFDDGFGGTITRDDYNVDWYVNGTKVDFAGGNVATIKNALNATIATIEKVSDGTKALSAIKFTGNAAGTYRVSVSADNGNLTAARLLL